jgi:hypothetical protein
MQLAANVPMKATAECSNASSISCSPSSPFAESGRFGFGGIEADCGPLGVHHIQNNRAFRIINGSVVA